MTESVKRRAYDSSKRREAARLRRLRILKSARNLFLAAGYPAATVAEIAANAQVSEDLVFRLFGSKRASSRRSWTSPSAAMTKTSRS